MKRKVFEQQNIDYSTGEIVSINATYVTKNDETFTFQRTTEGLAWIKELNSAVEWQLLSVLVDISNTKDCACIVTPQQREEICTFLGIATKTFYNTMTKLVKKDFIRKSSAMNYIVNPHYFYKGGTTMLKDKLKNYKQGEYNGLDDTDGNTVSDNKLLADLGGA